ncbi:Metacaspase type II [Favolaschia claudopus]|uniref:Metacaspase type II n=1 Tax=Favolaschia claudopus TaxID=2862362 RepID=A0AAW0D703_9AGAR
MTGVCSRIPKAFREHSIALPGPRVDGQNFKALLIGIRGLRTASDDYPPLNGSHKDVKLLRDLLMDHYGYLPHEITVLIDDGVVGHEQPTRVNILNAIKHLVKDAKSGDHLCFHFCGHSMQVKNRTNTEEDGWDECMIPWDGPNHYIIDNELNAALVQPLPAGCQLVAVLDTCHSGSMLDLKHDACNNVFVPWLQAGNEATENRPRVVRNNARWLSRVTSILPSRTSSVPPLPPAASPLLAQPSEINMNLMCTSPLPIVPQEVSGRRATRLLSSVPRRTYTYRAATARLVSEDEEIPNTTSVEIDHAPASALPRRFWVLSEAQRCASPIPIFECNGWCRENDPAGSAQCAGVVRADVICIASCGDDEVSYEDGAGNSMTTALVKTLRENLNQSLKQLLISVRQVCFSRCSSVYIRLCFSHAMHTQARIRHGNAKKFKQETIVYNDWVDKKNTEQHTRTMSLDVTHGDEPRRLSPSTTFPAPKKSWLAHLKHTLVLKRLVFQSKHPLNVNLDLDKFQNPVLSSARPLDMEARFRP